MTDAIKTIVDFVEGRLGPLEFEQLVFNEPSIEALLENDPDRQRESYVGRSLYQFVIAQDFRTLDGVLDIQGALREFLARKEIPFKPTIRYEERHAVLIAAQPNWLDVDLACIEQWIADEKPNLEGAPLQEWIRQKLLERFRFAVEPPTWIQSPQWPIGPNGPYVFLGQLELSGYFHDEASIYVFHDPKTGEFVTIAQVA